MKRGTPDHPKVYELAELLGCSRVTAIGYLELLWHFTATYAPQGNIGKYPDKRIEAALDWRGRSGKLLAALTTSGWVVSDSRHGRVVHDWSDHLDRSVRQRLDRMGLKPVVEESRVCGKNEDFTVIQSEKSGFHLPVPVPDPLPDPIPLKAHSGAQRVNGNGHLDELWGRFKKISEERGILPGGKMDWDWAYHAWKILDHEQKAAAIADCENRPADSAELEKGLPQNYIKGRKWERPMPKEKNGTREFLENMKL